MSEREFSFEDAVFCCQKATSFLDDVDIRKRSADTRCPCNPSSSKKKLHINLEAGWFKCQRCKAAGKNPVSLFMHVAGISDSRAAAREMHRLLGDPEYDASFQKKVIEDRPQLETYEAAPIEVRDQTYKTMLNTLSLSKAHRESLMVRGLTSAQIDALGYRSLPRDRKELCRKLLVKGCVLEGVPGFYKDKQGNWTINTYGTGIFIPWKSGLGKIQYMQIRKDKSPSVCQYCDHFRKGHCLLDDIEIEKDRTCDRFKERGMRYFTLSSPDKDCGTGAKTWIHARKGWQSEDWKEVIITEGALKADVASCISGKNFLAVAGVGNIGDLPRALRDLYLAGLERVYLSYDNEPDNPAVLDGERKIGEMLELLRVPYKKITWPELGLKGIDDWLKAEKL